ncbi:MAG: hypothetical protein FWC21_01505 [Treponema sp.]|nr:hypothetical protein [Treponema sp.]
MKQNVLLIVIIFILINTGSLFAQNPQELRINSFLSGNLSPDQEIWYSVRTTSAGILSVSTTSNIDTFLEAYDAQRNYITADDDGGDELNANIQIRVLANTTYLFKLRGYSNTVSGPFRIFAEHKPLTVLSSGTAVSGNITPGQSIWYTFQTTSAGYLTIETTGNTNTFLQIYNEDFDYIQYDDDSGEYPNARVKMHVTTGEIYYILLNAHDGGAFRITAASQPYPAPTQLAAGSFLNGYLVSGGENWYSVRAIQNGYLTVETTGSIDTVLNAYDSNYVHLAYDDDSAGYPNPRIRLQVTSGQLYIFALSGIGSGISGSFRIMASNQPYPTPEPLNIGTFISGYLELNGELWYSVRTAARGRLVVETTGSTDTVLEAYDSSYNFLDRNDDTWNDDYVDRNARIVLDAAANQTYIFRLTGFNEGSFRLLAGME